jgi:hypothetical protein
MVSRRALPTAPAWGSLRCARPARSRRCDCRMTCISNPALRSLPPSNRLRQRSALDQLLELGHAHAGDRSEHLIRVVVPGHVVGQRRAGARISKHDLVLIEGRAIKLELIDDPDLFTLRVAANVRNAICCV